MKKKNENGLVRATDFSVAQFTSKDVATQIEMINELLKSVMKENEHFGKIPGCGDKLVLLKPGAEKLAFMFRLAPTFQINIKELPNNHREYEVITTLTHIPTQTIFSQGIGICSTMESKFRYRWIDTNLKPNKEEANKLKAEGKGKWSKKGNEFIWQSRIENENISDVYNTVLKIAKKRSFVDAVITATSASDIFTQDLEEEHLEDNTEIKIDLAADSNKTINDNYTEKINSINSLDELKDYFNSLTEKEQKNLMKLFKQRKEEILQTAVII